METSIFSSEEPRASHSQSPDSGADWMTRVVTSCSPIYPSLIDTAPAGSSGKTSPESCTVREDGTLAPSSGGWRSSGTGSPTEFLTLNTSECPSDAVESTLSGILEGTGSVPQRFYLSKVAARGVLKRAAQYGKLLDPPEFRAALESVAGETYEQVRETIPPKPQPQPEASGQDGTTPSPTPGRSDSE